MSNTDLEECPICLDTARDPAFLHCGHFFCREHLHRLRSCPICRRPIRRWEIQKLLQGGRPTTVPRQARSGLNSTQRSLPPMTGKLLYCFRAFLSIGIVFLCVDGLRSFALSKSLRSIEGQTVSTESNRIVLELEGKLIHISDLLQANSSTPLDPILGFKPKDVLMIKKHVEIYHQWVEDSETARETDKEDNEAVRVAFTYRKGWRSDLTKLGDIPPPRTTSYEVWEIMWGKRTQTAESIQLGSYVLPNRIVEEQIPASWYEDYTNFSVNDIPYSRMQFLAKKTDSGFLYFGSSSSPRIGDLRVSFKVVKQREVTIVAQQVGSSLGHWEDPVLGSIFMLKEGRHDSSDMFQLFRKEARVHSCFSTGRLLVSLAFWCWRLHEWPVISGGRITRPEAIFREIWGATGRLESPTLLVFCEFFLALGPFVASRLISSAVSWSVRAFLSFLFAS